MFGYISPIQSEMEPQDWAAFRAFYCGTCKQMGRLARMTLSYECTFLAVMRAGCGNPQPVCQKRCVANPFKKVDMVLSEDTLYAAKINTLLAYYDLCDKIQDGAGKTIRLLRFFLAPKARKIRKQLPEVAGKTGLRRFTMLPKRDKRILKKNRKKFKELQTVAAPGADRQGPLGRFFYNIGRWIYLQDAMNDFEQDIYENQYNVLVNRYHSLEKAQEAMEFSLWHTLGEADVCIEQLKPGPQVAGIVEHMIACALPEKTEAALDRGGDGAESI